MLQLEVVYRLLDTAFGLKGNKLEIINGQNQI